jgi:hypothetical protein
MQIMLHCRARVPFFKLTAMIVLWPCIEPAFEPSSWPAHSHPLPIHVSAPGPSMSSMSSTPPFPRATETAANRTRRVLGQYRHNGRFIITFRWFPGPTSAVSPSSSVPSSRDVCGTPMPPRHPAAGAWWPPTHLDSPKSCLTYTSGRSYGHDKRSRGAVSCVRASARKSYRNLIATTTGLPARDGLHLMVPLRRANANLKIPLVYCLPLHLSRVLGYPFLVHATAVRFPWHGSAALSVPALFRGIPARL